MGGASQSPPWPALALPSHEPAHGSQGRPSTPLTFCRAVCSLCWNPPTPEQGPHLPLTLLHEKHREVWEQPQIKLSQRMRQR